jgi:anti-sigma B factor antagonist
VEIIEEIQDDINIYRLKGRLDSNTFQRLEEKLFQAISDGSKRIIVDFKNLNYISSAGLRVIIKANKALIREDGRMILCSMQKYVREIFNMTGIDSFVPTLDTMDDSLKDF